ncbi:MAG: hypothetical protein KKG06_09610 [Bacteroidetes bacterium]|nr:hypothetical protein [Bacteroidota bacterium]
MNLKNIKSVLLSFVGTNDAAMDVITDGLDYVRKYFILTPSMKKQLTLVDKRFAEAGLMGAKQSGLYKP